MRFAVHASDNLAMVEAAPKKEGRHLFMILAPDPAKVKEFKKLQEQDEKTSEEAGSQEPATAE